MGNISLNDGFGRRFKSGSRNPSLVAVYSEKRCIQPFFICMKSAVTAKNAPQMPLVQLYFQKCCTKKLHGNWLESKWNKRHHVLAFTERGKQNYRALYNLFTEIMMYKILNSTLSIILVVRNTTENSIQSSAYQMVNICGCQWFFHSVIWAVSIKNDAFLKCIHKHN